MGITRAIRVRLTFSFPMNRPVAQVGNLLYRRLAVGRHRDRLEHCGLPIRDTADCQSALRFRGSKREIWFRRILTLSLPKGEGNGIAA